MSAIRKPTHIGCLSRSDGIQWRIQGWGGFGVAPPGDLRGGRRPLLGITGRGPSPVACTEGAGVASPPLGSQGGRAAPPGVSPPPGHLRGGVARP